MARLVSDGVTPIKFLASSVLAAKNTVYGFKNAGVSTRGLEEEIEVFAFVFPILGFENPQNIQPALSHD
ncbi:hypothetical protein E2P81_ATG07646 [Venturia nashicola]|uniref:Uncharacterized protein n=1 Tax=Venturia nashicola TaxID=86259 RepID=A0A4Z1NIB9_9PEZI|nr:hypothetical protein E6O75_ATG07809 [Venturia nashicola]TLD22453.1 hypothetical protein E2P81_ATG07646 [Venturia nashicola]